jgi:hypothetical protein
VDFASSCRFGGPCCLHLQVVTPCSVVVGYQRFEGPCCLHLQGEDEAATLISCHITKRGHNPGDHDLNNTLFFFLAPSGKIISDNEF